MTGAGGNIGGGACKRSMTVLAISAAERICGAFGARAVETRRTTVFFNGRLGATPGGAPLTSADLRARRDFGAGTDFGTDGALRIARLSFSLAAGRGGRAVPAASTWRRACFAAFFAALNALRACLSSALAKRTCLLAAAARAADLTAAPLSFFSVDGLAVIYGSTRNKN